jgi:hypothetical protein
VLLVAYGAFLYLAQWHFVVFFDDETLIVGKAARQPPLETIRLFIGGAGQHEHPPLYDVLLHLWMRATDDSQALLRVPSIAAWCLAVGLIAATAQRLWGRGRLALVLAMAWPLGLFVGTPAHWSALAMLGIAASTWAYFRWRERGETSDAVLFALASIVLFWTNYLGLAFIGMLGIHFLATRPDARTWRQGVVAGVVLLVGIAPLVSPFVYELQHGPETDRTLLAIVADVVFHAWALLVSESVAPWTVAAAPVALGALYLGVRLAAGWRQAWPWIGLAAVFLASGLLGILSGKRIGLFGPWLVLCLAHLVHTDARPGRVLAAIAVVFGMGWVGVVHGGWGSTFRYVEPWDEAIAQAMAWSGPGDWVVAEHPAFYFQARYDLGWDEWFDSVPETTLQASDRRFASFHGWREAVAAPRRLVYVRTVVDWRRIPEKTAFEAHLGRHFRLVEQRVWLEDPAVELKRRFVPDPPQFRLEVRAYEPRRPGPRPGR